MNDAVEMLMEKHNQILKLAVHQRDVATERIQRDYEQAASKAADFLAAAQTLCTHPSTFNKTLSELETVTVCRICAKELKVT